LPCDSPSPVKRAIQFQIELARGIGIDSLFLMRFPLLCCLSVFFLLIELNAKAASSDWLSSPKPKFPTSSLQKGSEGLVKLRLKLTTDGSVTNAAIVKSSGDQVLDEVARNAVLKWRMKPGSIKPSDLTKGRIEEIEFKQEAILAAGYPDRKAYFSSWEHTEWWMFAPFPSYPLSERRLRHTGTVLLYGRIAEDGHVADVRVLQSSGFSELDQCAVAGLRLWRAHKKYAGVQFKLPIHFSLGR
jgi:TonB family protein